MFIIFGIRAGTERRPCRPVVPLINFKSHVTNQYKRWDPIGITKILTLINTICCKPDDGRIRPKHVAS